MTPNRQHVRASKIFAVVVVAPTARRVLELVYTITPNGLLLLLLLLLQVGCRASLPNPAPTLALHIIRFVKTSNSTDGATVGSHFTTCSKQVVSMMRFSVTSSFYVEESSPGND